MNTIYDVNADNFLILAIKHYDKPNCLLSEFDEDMKRVKYIKRLFKRYKSTGDLKERLILNHIIILGNVFSVEFTVKMLFYKIEPEHYSILKPFLVLLSYMPDTIKSINGNIIRSSDIIMDDTVIGALRAI